MHAALQLSPSDRTVGLVVHDGMDVNSIADEFKCKAETQELASARFGNRALGLVDFEFSGVKLPKAT